MLKVGNRVAKLAVKWVTAIGILGIAIYPIIIGPMMNPKEYRDIQKITRKDIDRTKIQPGNMKMWTDPFEKK